MPWKAIPAPPGAGMTSGSTRGPLVRLRTSQHGLPAIPGAVWTSESRYPGRGLAANTL